MESDTDFDENVEVKRKINNIRKFNVVDSSDEDGSEKVIDKMSYFLWTGKISYLYIL